MRKYLRLLLVLLLAVSPAWAASPTVAATATSTDNASDTTQTIALPASISSGDLLLMMLGYTAAIVSTTTPTGWTLLVADTSIPASQGALVAFYRQADGTEGGSVDVTTDVNTAAGGSTYRITGHEDPATQAPEVTSVTLATATNPDPPAITPTGGSKDYLFIACLMQDGNPTPTGSPANYSNELATSIAFGAVSNRTIERELTASSEDPGNWTIAISNEWGTYTIAVHPSGAAPVVRRRVTVY